MKPRVLIVGTVPYNTNSTSRAFDSYFHYWDKESLAQIFSNTKTPCKGHCASLYQITDARLLKRRFSKKVQTGQIFNYDDLPTHWSDNDLEVGSHFFKKLYDFGSRKNSLVYLLRRLVWKKKLWYTDQLNRWLDEFRPECVFLSFSDDFFILQIALYVAKRYDIPIVSSIGDDYFFNYKKTISPLYHIYKRTYQNLVQRIFEHRGSAIYIGNKIRDKYNEFFSLNGKTVYLTSDLSRRPFKPISVKTPVFSYFGNIRLGRNDSLNEIATALGSLNQEYRLHIYSNESDKKYYKELLENPYVVYHGCVPYNEVQKKTLESDVLVVVEGFRKKDVDITRYSLSTKVADSIASGVQVFAYGSIECGAIEYAKETGCITTCTNKNELLKTLDKLINDVECQKENYAQAVRITQNNHNLESSTTIFYDVVKSVVGKENSC